MLEECSLVGHFFEKKEKCIWLSTAWPSRETWQDFLLLWKIIFLIEISPMPYSDLVWSTGQYVAGWFLCLK